MGILFNGLRKIPEGRREMSKNRSPLLQNYFAKYSIIMNLKNLYQFLVVNRDYEYRAWHDEYKILFEAIADIRLVLNQKGYEEKTIEVYEYNNNNTQKIKDIGAGTNVTNYKDLLQVLFYDITNGISGRGQSVLSQENLKRLQDDPEFIKLVSEMIRIGEEDIQEIKEKEQAITNKWENFVGHKNPVLLNRFIAACTNKVSTTVDADKFNKVVNWLRTEKICEEGKLPTSGTWIEQNATLMELFEKELNNGSCDDYDTYWRNMFVWIIYENIADKFQMKKAIVKYGPPGTGKTYKAKQETKLRFDIWKDFYASGNKDYDYDNHIESVQFHPSYTYEDFIEGIRPELDTNHKSQLRLQNGSFKDFCKKAGKWEVDLYRIDPKKKWSDTTFEELRKEHKKSLEELEEHKHWEYIFEYKGNDETKIFDIIPPFFFIIDEINRADLSRVFGELMYCLEYRGTEGKIKTQYSKLNDDTTGMLKVGDNDYRFFIPNNVYVIGTMNTIDRSVESFDFALRRRFSWEEVNPNHELLRDHLEKEYPKEWVGLAKRMKDLNVEIANDTLLGPDYQIGHAYFWKLPDPKWYENLSLNKVAEMIWDERIKPLLQEYLRGTGKETDVLKTLRKTMVN